MAELLTLRADEVKPFDALTEGTWVCQIEFEPIADEQGRSIEITSCTARWHHEADDVPGDVALHSRVHVAVDVRRHKRGDIVRVIRPAPLEPCSECGWHPNQDQEHA